VCYAILVLNVLVVLVLYISLNLYEIDVINFDSPCTCMSTYAETIYTVLQDHLNFVVLDNDLGLFNREKLCAV
jgi:hypothetical protein